MFSYSKVFNQNIVDDKYINIIINKSNDSNTTFINKLATIINKNVDSIYLNYCFKEDIKVNTKGIIFNIKKISIAGDTFYKQFSIANQLLPTKIVYKINLFNIDKPIYLNHIEINGLNSKGLVNYTYLFNDTIQVDNYVLNVEARNLIYDEQVLENLINKISLIDDYYKVIATVSDAIMQLDNMNLNDIDKIPLYNLTLQELGKTKNVISEKQLYYNLSLYDYDPQNFNFLFKAFSEKLDSIKNKISEIFSGLDFYYTRIGIKYFEEGDFNMAIDNLAKAIQFNPFYIPAQIGIAKINIRKGNLFAAADSISKILNVMNPTPEDKEEIHSTISLLLAAFNNQGNELLIKEDFNAAVSVFEQAIKFCLSLQLFDCNTENLTTGLTRAKTGIYLSYLKIARKALNNERLEMASSYVKMAKEYKHNNLNEIKNDEDDIILNNIIDAYTRKGLNYLNVKNYEKAMEQFNLAQELTMSLSLVNNENKLSEGIMIAKQGIYKGMIFNATSELKKGNIDNAENIVNKAIEYQQLNKDVIINTLGTDTIMLTIKKRKYENLIGEGKRLLGYGQYEEALNVFVNAKEMGKIWKFKRDNLLDTLLALSAKPVIIENLLNAQIKAWGNDLSEAEKFYKTAYIMQYNYNLVNDSDINKEIDKLNKKIYERKCQNAQDLYNKYYAQAIKSITASDFVVAGNYLDLAINVAIDFFQCNISVLEASEKKSEYLPAITYQNLIATAEKAYYIGNYPEAVINYATASNYYKDYRVYNMGLVHINFSDFMLLYDNPDFLMYCINYFTEKEMYNDALSALNILKNKQYDVKKTKKLQKQLGIKMSIYDKENNKKKIKVLLLKYTNNDKYYRVFRRYYKLSWHNMNSFIFF